MTSGLTRLASWHKAAIRHPIAEAAGIGRTILLLATLASLLTGGALLGGIGNADIITSSLTSDGSLLSTTSLESGDKLMAGRILACGLSHIIRDMDAGENAASVLDARSDGPLLFREYASRESGRSDPLITCVFGNTSPQRDTTVDEISGIFGYGSYASATTLSQSDHITRAHGRGLLDIRHLDQQNGTLRTRSLASGNLSLSEAIREDQGYSP